MVDGRNVAIEYHFANGQLDRLPAIATNLVARPASLIFAGGIPASLAAKAATSAIPIVFYVSGDPVDLGLVATLNRPSGNLTGVTSLGIELSAKRFELAHELLPRAHTIGLLVNPHNPATGTIVKDTQRAARNLGFQLQVLRATKLSEVSAGFATMAKLRGAPIVIGNDGLFIGHTDEIAALGLRYSVPTIFQTPEFTAVGGLISYGSSISDAYRQAGIYVGRILKGERPGNLPVLQSEKIELIVNLKTAKALDLTVPISVLGRADTVIE